MNFYVLTKGAGWLTRKMIGALLEYLRRSTGQLAAALEKKDQENGTEKWKNDFFVLMQRSEQKPSVLVDLARKGFPESLRSWTWCTILKIEQVPGILLHLRAKDDLTPLSNSQIYSIPEGL